MTSETTEKKRRLSERSGFVVRAGLDNSMNRRAAWLGPIVVGGCWTTIYFWVLAELLTGVSNWIDYVTGVQDRDYIVYRATHSLLTSTATALLDGLVEYGSGKFYALCGLGGILSCGITHTAIVPLDLVKCRIQVNPEKYKNIGTGFRVTVAEEGTRALVKGWAPTFVGYSLQGLGKFGFYELFKKVYADALGEEGAYLYRTSLYLAASASAEFFADILLAPLEATKVRVQTQPGAPPTLRGCAPLIYRNEGLSGFYKGLPPLWGRQIPYTMMKFAAFERTVELLYAYVVPKPRADCSKSEQLVVTFAAGYIAGVFCAIVSHPADTLVSKLNQDASATIGSIVKKLGFAGLWKGLVPRIIMIGTLTALQWFIYDSFKVAFNLPRPPPPEMPESLKKKLAAAGQTAH